jgi:hypothetical protein
LAILFRLLGLLAPLAILFKQNSQGSK